MSFIRPELAAALARWREPLVWGGVTAIGFAALWRGARSGGPFLLVIGLLIAGAGLGLLAGALARRRVQAPGPEPGMVSIDEGRIGYFGPVGGGFVDLPALVEVAIIGEPGTGERAWSLRGEDGTRLVIPLGAHGAEHLPDALAALPGFALGRGAAPRGPGRPGRIALWRRAPEPPTIAPWRG